MVYEFVHDGTITIQQGADELGISVEELSYEKRKYVLSVKAYIYEKTCTEKQIKQRVHCSVPSKQLYRRTKQ